jgi:hypothetical protein
MRKVSTVMEVFKVGDWVVRAKTRDGGRIIKVLVKRPKDATEPEQRSYLVQWDDGTTSEESSGIERER